MPTTQDEAQKIVDISMRHFPDVDRLHRLFVELDERVGKVSDNDSVRQSLAMFRVLIEGAAREQSRARAFAPVPQDQGYWKTVYWSNVLLHHTLVLGNIASFAFIPYAVLFQGAAWYFAFPAWFAILWVLGSRSDCLLTEKENKARTHLGWPTIKTFVGHYYAKPVYKMKARWRRHGIVAHG